MRWLLPNGKKIWINDKKYRINWDRPAPSKGSQILKNYLRKRFPNEIIYEEYVLPVRGERGGKLRSDFILGNRLKALEFNDLQTGHHDTYVPFFHGNSRVGYLQKIKNDVKKIKFLTDNGYSVIEIYQEDLDKLDEILK